MKDVEIQEGQIRQLFASVVWTHKIQEKQSDLYIKKYKVIETVKTFLLALTSSGIISILFVDDFWLKVVSALSSAISLFISVYYETYDLKTQASIHKKTALLLFRLRDSIISILADIKCNKLSYEEIILKKNDAYTQYFEICNDAKDVSEKAVNKASKYLKKRKDNTYSDEEIDSFLPIGLRKNIIMEESNDNK